MPRCLLEQCTLLVAKSKENLSVEISNNNRGLYAHSVAVADAEGLALASTVARVRTLVVLDVARADKCAAKAVEVAVPLNGKLSTAGSDGRSGHATESGSEGLEVASSRASAAHIY